MGLIGGIARTAVAAGTWTAVSNRVNRRQYNRWSQQEQQQYAQPQYAPQQQYAAPQQYSAQQYAAQPAPAAAAGAGARDRVDQLKDLANLKQQGILSQQEFEAEKARILAG
jgi:hypothetical protein